MATSTHIEELRTHLISLMNTENANALAELNHIYEVCTHTTTSRSTEKKTESTRKDFSADELALHLATRIQRLQKDMGYAHRRGIVDTYKTWIAVDTFILALLGGEQFTIVYTGNKYVETAMYTIGDVQIIKCMENGEEIKLFRIDGQNVMKGTVFYSFIDVLENALYAYLTSALSQE